MDESVEVIGWLQYVLGLRTDTEDAAGSLHSKVLSRQSPRGPAGAPGEYDTVATSYQTALDITGKGKLIALGATDDGNCTYFFVKLTVDGTLLSAGRNTTSTAANTMHYPGHNYLLSSSGAVFITAANGGSPRFAEIEFKESLKIELKTKNASNRAYAYWQYVIEN